MPTAKLGAWFDVAVQRGLIRAVGPRPTIATATPAAPDALPEGLSEKAFQAAVVRLAKSNGWRTLHQFDSRRTAAGWPDLVLLRGPVLILAELKRDGGRTTPAQRDWLDALRAVPGVRVRLWRPALWPAIHAELTAPAR